MNEVSPVEINQNTNTPGDELELMVKDANVIGLLAEISETGIDNALGDSVGTIIPVVGVIRGINKMIKNSSKRTQIKKIYDFLFEIKDIPQDIRQKKIDEINSSKEEQGFIGNVILETLEAVESGIKPKILGKLLAASMQGKFDFYNYLKLAHIVKTIFYGDLEILKNQTDDDNIVKGNILPEWEIQGLIESSNVVYVYNKSEKDKPQIKARKLTFFGRILIQEGMN